MATIDSKLNESKFESIEKVMNLQYSFLKESIVSITEQLNNVTRKTDEISEKIQNTIMDNQKHYSNCPNTQKVEKLNERIENYEKSVDKRLEDFTFFLKNPKLFIGIITVCVLIVIVLSYAELVNLQTSTKLAKTTEFYRSQYDEPVLRGGETVKSVDSTHKESLATDNKK